MPNSLGGDTRDITILGQTHPAETHLPAGGVPAREHLNQRFGRRALITGGSLIIGSLITSTIMPDKVINAVPPLVAHTLMFCFVGAGICGVVIWGVEVLSRYNRTLARQHLTRLDSFAERVQKNYELLEALERQVADLARTVDERMRSFEQAIEKVPDYGAGVIDGATMRQAAVQERDLD